MHTKNALSRSTPVRAALLAVALSAAAFSSFAAPAAAADDAQLASQVKAALAQAWQLKNADIVVQASQGQVHLSGWVVYPEDVQLAERLAHQVSGVAAVDDSFRTWSSSDR